MLLNVEHLEVGYQKKPILPPVSFTVEPGEVWGIIGPNGSGKSTLLKTILGLLTPIKGRVERSESVIGYVAQRHALDPSVPSRVVDVVAAGVETDWSFLKPWHPRHNRDAIEQAMADCDIRDLRNHQFNQLSEGQKQRVLLARALASNPQLIILDEPTSAMDQTAERAVFELLTALRKKRGIAVLLVSHHLPVLGEFATHAVYVDRDEQVMITGDIDTVCHCNECVARYGDALHRHRHTDACQH